MSEIVPPVLMALASAAVVATCILTFLRMDECTNHFIRAAYTLICCGAFGEMWAMLAGLQPSMVEFVFVIGSGALIAFDRRAGAHSRPLICVRKDELNGHSEMG